jgi:hypothetical protein
VYENQYWIGWAAGSWGTSWGGIPVAETWDTDQGVARNLARNLAFERIEDVDVVPYVSEQAGSGANTPKGSGSATAVVVGGGCYSGTGFVVAGGSVRANAYVKPESVGAFVGVNSTTAVADSMTAVTGGGAACGSKVPSFSCDSEAVPTSYYQGVSGVVSEIFVRGIQNPTDEEIAVLVNLLTSKRKRDTTRTSYRG